MGYFKKICEEKWKRGKRLIIYLTICRKSFQVDGSPHVGLLYSLMGRFPWLRHCANEGLKATI